MPNLLDNVLTTGCMIKFHRPYKVHHKADYNLLVPEKYMAIKDDIPGFDEMNLVKHPGSENPLSLPSGYDYEVPLSLNAETCFSEFRNIEKVTDKTNSINNGSNNQNSTAQAQQRGRD